MTAFILWLVDFARRHALAVVAVSALMVAGGLWSAATRLGVDTDTGKMLSPELPWRQNEIAFNKAFPQNADLIAVVVTAETPDQAGDASAAIEAKLKRDTEHFRSVRRPDGGMFFARNGLLFLSADELRKSTQQMIDAQPLIAQLAADPSLRGLFGALDLALTGVEQKATELATLANSFKVVNATAKAALQGNAKPMSWQDLLTGRKPTPEELQRFVLVQPKLDYGALAPGKQATDAIRAAVRDLGFDQKPGLSVRITGQVPLDDEQFSSVSHGIVLSTSLTIALTCLVLFLALRSVKLIASILVTLISGLILTAGFAALTVGDLNLVSVAFAVLFVGLAVDFGIQFTVRYRDERFRQADLPGALRGAARIAGPPLLLAAITIAAAFYAFLPTDYRGFSQLGLIAGSGMLIAITLTLTLLPALLTLFMPRGEPEPVGFAWAAPIDKFLLHRRVPVLAIAGALALVGIAMIPRLNFDFNPINLNDPNTEAMRTVMELAKNPGTTPYTIDVLAPDIPAAAALADRLSKLPEVSRAISISSYVPEDQSTKLAILDDASFLLGPALAPIKVAPPPTDQQVLDAIGRTVAKLRALATGQPGSDIALDFANTLDQVLARGAGALPGLREALLGGLPGRLADLNVAVSAQKVTLAEIPDELKRDWMTADGRARVQVFPAGDSTDNAVLRNFSRAVAAVAPDAVGPPISIQASADTIIHAFLVAASLALVSIASILFVILRSMRVVAMVILPLLLAALMTGLTSEVFAIPFNFANIVVLPLLLGIGVAFDIYFVTNWRVGLGQPLQSATARAVLFSALATSAAFGTLMLSPHPGTAGMGQMLVISLFWVLVCTLFVLPSLLGPVRVPAPGVPDRADGAARLETGAAPRSTARE